MMKIPFVSLLSTSFSSHHLHLIKRFARTRKLTPTTPPRQLPPPRGSSSSPQPEPMTKRLDCVIIGTPNVGKSVLLNTLIKKKIAATSRKRHTTRNEILGVFNHRDIQLVFYDTPGYITDEEKKKSDLQILRELANTTLEKADVVMLVVDASRRLSHNYRYVFGELVKLALAHSKKELILVLNKVDLVEPKAKLLDLTRDLVSLINGVKLGPEKAHLAQLDTTTFMISGLKNDGVLDLKNYLLRIAEPKPWIVTEGHTTLTPEEVVEEVLLESLLNYLHDEIPYIAELNCTSIKALDHRRVQIDVDIVLDSGRQVRMVVGDKGRTLLLLRQSAVEELEKMDAYKGKVVLLFLWAKTQEEDEEE